MRLSSRATKVPAALSIAPSQEFEGNDGPWSTFAISVGTPAQVFHILISTSGQETWVPVPEGCTPQDPSNCGALRGVEPFQGLPSSGFQINASSTWIYKAIEELGDLEADLNYTGNGEYGFDTVGLELPGSGGPTLPHQIVAGIAAKDFYLGVFGLGPKPTNFTSFTDTYPSYLWTLKNQSIIPSLSWGYTAGAPYQQKQVPGSLTLGGYDLSRFTANNLSFSMAADDSKPLTVGLQLIQASNSLKGPVAILEGSAILTFLDSTVPEIWLPETACTIFENVFGLQYDPSTDRYLVNSTIHDQLVSMNPSLTFSLANNITSKDVIQISLPYKAFDLVADYPIYPNATNYFPLRRAVNDSQYTLGRVFFQEAYVIADYERNNFSVSQCVFNDNSAENIVPIYTPSTNLHKSKMSNKILIPIIVVVVVVVLLLASGGYVYYQVRKKRKLRKQAAEVAADVIAQTENKDANVPVVEISPHEKHLSSEMSGDSVLRHEMESPKIDQEVQQVTGRHELSTPTFFSELPAEEVQRNYRNTL